MKKCLLILIVILLSSVIISSPLLAAGKKKYRVLIIQHQNFASYTLSLKGFKQGIKSSKLSDQISFVAYNAKNDLKALDRYIAKLQKRKDIDLIFSIGTQTTKRLVKNITHIPIVFTDLGTPEYSGVITDWKSSKANYTGVEMKNYVSLGINLLHELIPFKRIGMIYLKGAPSHEGTIKKITQMSQETGFRLISKGLVYRDKNKKELPNKVLRKRIKQALSEVVPKVDVFYVQTSKTFDINFDLFFDAFKQYNVPSAGDPIYIKKGLVVGIGRNKIQFGKQCAEYAVQILKGKKPADLPMDVGKKFSILLNIKAASIVGYNPSIDIISAADKIYKKIETK